MVLPILLQYSLRISLTDTGSNLPFFQDYAAPDDILPYSIDEGFIDLTSSLLTLFLINQCQGKIS